MAGLDLDVEPGERLLLLGPSGSGKSTVLGALAGVLGDEDEGLTAGELLVDGRPAGAARGTAGLVLQDPDSQIILSRVGDDAAFGAENLGVERAEIWSRVRAALDAVGLRVALDAPTGALSGGQKQRLALAGVLAMRPSLLLLDEPTANLDPDGVAEVRAAVAAVLERRESTLIVVEHRVGVWRDLVDRIVVLDERGGVLADGAPSEVLSAQAEPLQRAGVWIPGAAVSARPRASGQGGEPLLVAEGLAVGRKGAPVAQAGIDLAVRAGRVHAVTGPNGSGKTTLGLTLAGLLPAAGGELRASSRLASGAGHEPVRWTSRQLLTRIGTVFQDPEHQFVTGSVRGELEIGPRALRMSPELIRSRSDELLARLRLDHLAGANPFTLSGGEKRRLSVASMLATAPAVLVLDEPTFGQDARTWAEMVALVGELRDGGTATVAISHDEEFVSALADDVHRLAFRAAAREPSVAGAGS